MALTADRNTPRMQGDIRQGGLAADETVYAGGIVMRNAAGYLVAGQTDTDLVGAGVALAQAANAGDAGDVSVDYRPGIFRFNNSESGDAIAAADIGNPCFAVDDETVAKTDGTASRSIAGFVEGVDALGVWVRFDEALARSYVAGITEPAG